MCADSRQSGMSRRRARESHHDWMKRHLGFLLSLKNEYLQKDIASPQDAEYGFWSIKKLIAVNYLIPTFCKLALTGNFTRCYYLDLLAGSGILRFGDILPGSAMVALAADTPAQGFEKYFFIESDKQKATLLEKRLQQIGRSLANRRFEVRAEDCNRALPTILGEIYSGDPSRSCFLALFDPEGYAETAWSTLETLLGHGKGDLIFNFTEGVARNVEKARTDKSYRPLLERYFGEPESEWLHLKGYDELIEHYKTKLASVNGITRTVFRIDVRDQKKRPLYGLLFATGSSGFANVIEYLKSRLDMTEARHLQNIYDQLMKKIKPLSNYQ